MKNLFLGLLRGLGKIEIGETIGLRTVLLLVAVLVIAPVYFGIIAASEIVPLVGGSPARTISGTAFLFTFLFFAGVYIARTLLEK